MDKRRRKEQLKSPEPIGRGLGIQPNWLKSSEHISKNSLSEKRTTLYQQRKQQKKRQPLLTVFFKKAIP
ncbi:MAG: hypothetical protein EA341_03780 [Mongoliibacter sp.]|nr:MAG: hypothetical protein EA341_03780 [Mongoliibacter sp.]